MVHYNAANDWRRALKVAEAEMLESSYYVPFYLSAANLNMKLNNYDQYFFYLKKAFQLQPDSVVASNLIVSLVNHEKPEEAISYLEYMNQRNPSNKAYESVKNTVEKIVQLKAALQTDSNNINHLNSIAYLYLRMGNQDITSKYLNRALAVEPTNKTSLQILKKLSSMPHP
jgi:tetratricopeptide (TPR) repeat protein